MTVRFKSEYQRSYGMSCSRSASPLARLCYNHMASRSSPAHRTGTKTSTPPGAQADCVPPADPPPPAEPQSDPGPPIGSQNDTEPQTGPQAAVDPGPGQTGAAKPHPSRTNGQSKLSRPLMAAAVGRQLSANEVQHALQWRAGPRSVGQRSEYHRQFNLKKPVAAASPMLTAEQTIKKRRKESEKKPRPKHDVTTTQKDDSMAPPVQVRELRQRALSYLRRAWGTNFSRDHLSQLLSENNVLWEPTDSDPPTPYQILNPSDSSSSRAKALDLVSRSSNSSRRSAGPESAQMQPAEDTESQAICGEEQQPEEEGRLPTPRVKILPFQRTHHDLTTPATGGALLVGELKLSDESSSKQRCGSAIPMAVGAGSAVKVPVVPKEAWPDSKPTLLPSSGPFSNLNPAARKPPRPMRTKQRPLSPVAPPPNWIRGSLRHPDFQHNGELGLRLRELQRSGGGCGSDEDDRLSVMSWRSTASCSLASAVLERAQKRRENFWGKG